MKSRSNLKSLLRTFDEILANVYLPLTNEQGSLLSFVFHGLFRDRSEKETEVLDLQQGITVEMFREFVAHFQEQAYRFITPDELATGLARKERYLLVTFDDGYHNNVRALPVLEEFGVPAVFFVSSQHVQEGKAFWWDVTSRELKRRGKSLKEISNYIFALKRLKTTDVEARIVQEFGKLALKPLSDLDRPFTPSELRDFAASRFVHIGNHTKNHAILTNYTEEEIDDEIRGAQREIREMTGKTPLIVAYPNGNSSPAIQSLVKNAGLQYGLTVRAGKNRTPVLSCSQEAMNLKRFMLWGDRIIDQQCRACRSNFSVSRALKEFSLQPEPYRATARSSSL